MNSSKASLSLNYLITLYSALLPNTPELSAALKALRAELNFYRSQIYSRLLGKHDLAHEEIHQVIENRDTFD
jgi:hypothetical protein